MGCFGSKGDDVSVASNPAFDQAQNGGKGGEEEDFERSDDGVLKITCVGDGGVGKSAFYTRVVDNTYKADDKALVEQRNTKMTVKGKEYDIEMMDTCGQERFRVITTTYYRSAHGSIIAFDLHDKTTFANVSNWVNEVRTYGGNRILIILVGMKSDLPRAVSKEDAEDLASDLSISYFETSSLKVDGGVKECFTAFIEEIVQSLPEGKNA